MTLGHGSDRIRKLSSLLRPNGAPLFSRGSLDHGLEDGSSHSMAFVNYVIINPILPDIAKNYSRLLTLNNFSGC